MSRPPSPYYESHRSSNFSGNGRQGSNRHGDDRHERSYRYNSAGAGHCRSGRVRPGNGRFRHDVPQSNRHHDDGYSNYYGPRYRRPLPPITIHLQAQASVAEGKYYEDVMYLVSWEAKLGPIDTWPYKELSPRLKDCIDRVKRGKELGREGRAREEQEKMERRRMEWSEGGVRRRTGIVGWRERRGGYLTSVSDRYMDGRFDEPYRMGTEQIGGIPWDFGPERERMLYNWAATRNPAMGRGGLEGMEHRQRGRDGIAARDSEPVGAAAGGWPTGWPKGWYERTAAEVEHE